MNRVALILAVTSFTSCGTGDSIVAWTGTKQLGVKGAATYGISVAVGTNGDVYVAGTTTGGLDGNTLSGVEDSFVTKYDRFGIKQYTKLLGTNGAHTTGKSVATDAHGNVFVTGDTTGIFHENSIAKASDFFVAKYDSAGATQYINQFEVIGNDINNTTAATTSNVGEVYVAWSAFNGDTKISDLFVEKYNNEGVKWHTKQLGAAQSAIHTRSVVEDQNGNVYITGDTWGGLDGNARIGLIDCFIAKYDNEGVKQYSMLLGIGQQFETFCESIATDKFGNVYVTGYTNGGLDGNIATRSYDFFLVKYDSTGSKQFTKQLGARWGTTFGDSVAVDLTGNIYVVGSTTGGLDGNTLTGTMDFFITKFDNSGVKQFTKQYGVAGSVTGATSVAIDLNGNIFVAGVTQGGLDGNTVAGIRDFFVTKFDSDGVKQ